MTDDSRSDPHSALIRRTALKPETDGHAPPRGGPTDPLGAAKVLRDAPADAAASASRPVTALRPSSKPTKAPQTVPSSPEPLIPGTEEPR